MQIEIGSGASVLNSLDLTASAQLDVVQAKNPYFGLSVGVQVIPGGFSAGEPADSDGSYNDGVLIIYEGSLSISISNTTVTLQDNRMSGSFSGTGTVGNIVDRVTGTFSC